MPASSEATRSAALRARRRLPGLLGLGVVFVLYQPGMDPTLFNDLVLPLVAVVSAWLVTGSVLAIALGVALLAGAHCDLDASDTLSSVVYPGLAAAATLVILVTLARRFRAQLLQVRAERAQRREQTGPASGDGDDEPS